MNNIFGMTFIFGVAIILLITLIGVWIWALVDCITREMKTEEKVFWLAIILILNVVGAVVYLLLARNGKTIFKERKRKGQRKKLTRSPDDQMLAGVCGGLGDYFDVDSTIIRLVWILFTLFTSGSGLIFYIIAAIVIPLPEDVKKNRKKEASEQKGSSKTWIFVLIVIFMMIMAYLAIVMIVSFAGYKTQQKSFSFSEKTVQFIPKDMIENEIVQNPNYIENNGHSLRFLDSITIDGSRCFATIADPYGFEHHQICQELTFRFDVDDPQEPSLEGYEVKVIITDEIKKMEFYRVESARQDIMMTLPEETRSIAEERIRNSYNFQHYNASNLLLKSYTFQEGKHYLQYTYDINANMPTGVEQIMIGMTIEEGRVKNYEYTEITDI